MKPLTIEELKALKVGDWVWIKEPIDYVDGFYIKIYGIGDDYLFDIDSIIYQFADYGTKWQAWKNKEMAEAKGEIVKLPCKIGDSAYELWRDNDGQYHIDKNEVKDFEINYDYDIEIITGIWYEHYFGAFLTLEEAEVKLRELKGK